MNWQKRVKLAALFVLAFWWVVFSCSDVVDLKSSDGVRSLVIYGRVTDGLAGNEVFVGFTSSFGAEQEGISGARLSLIENGSVLGDYIEIGDGNYKLDLHGDSARVGRTYELQLELPDGSEYRSLPSVMPGLVAIDTPGFDASVVDVVINQEGLTARRNLVQLLVDTEILESEKNFYLRWNVFSTYSFQERTRNGGDPPPPCYITNDISGQQSRLFNGEKLKVDRIRDQLLATTVVDSRFAFDYYYTVVQSTMDVAAYEYFSLIDEVSNTEGSIFDKPPAAVIGNIKNTNNPEEQVLGYFEVVRSDTTRLRLRDNDVPGFIFHPCPLRVDYSEEPLSCLNCLLIRNSTHDRPYFWF